MKTSQLTKLVQDAQILINNLGPLPSPVDTPVFIALSGLPGTGKSFFSQQLAKRLPLAVLESDVLRKVLFPNPSYNWHESARLFRACYFVIEGLLRSGVSILFDATNLSEFYRRKLYNIAARTHVKFILVKIEAPPEVVQKRLGKRARKPFNTSDEDWKVYQAMKSREEEIRYKHYMADTTKSITLLINKIVREVKKEEV